MITLPLNLLNVPEAPAPLMLMPGRGRGTRLTLNSLGFSYSAAGGGRGWPHAFKPSMGGAGISFSRGLVFGVQGYEPTIEGKKISTGVQLRLEAEVANEDGESWACIRVEPNAAGVLEQAADGESVVTMVHTKTPVSLDPAFGLQPVALILWSGGRPVLVHEVLHFNVRYELGTKPGERPAKHFFL